MTQQEAQLLQKDDWLVDAAGQLLRYIGRTDHKRPKLVVTDGQFTFRLSPGSLRRQPTGEPSPSANDRIVMALLRGEPIQGLLPFLNPTNNPAFSSRLFEFLKTPGASGLNRIYRAEGGGLFIGFLDAGEQLPFRGAALEEVLTTGANTVIGEAHKQECCEWEDVTLPFWTNYLSTAQTSL